jgi:hypothetical protein
MKVRIISEDFPEGRVLDWAAVPREGEFVMLQGRAGETNLRVESVRWIADQTGSLIEVQLHLGY